MSEEKARDLPSLQPALGFRQACGFRQASGCRPWKTPLDLRRP